MKYCKESAKKIRVAGTYDVIVIGGGIAGISAALAAQRQGAKTLLIEKQFMLGGLATGGIVTIYLPICDGEGRQVCYGIAEELFFLAGKYGYEQKSEAWFDETKKEERKRQRFECQFNPNVFAILCEQLLLSEGVEVLYGTDVVGCKSGKRGKKNIITHVYVENKSGKSAYFGKNFIDASGDADLCHFSGAPTDIFREGNTLAAWYYYLKDGNINCKMLGFSEDVRAAKQKTAEETVGRYMGVDGEKLSAYMVRSHAATLSDYLKNNEEKVSCSSSLTMLATTPQVRMTRRLIADKTMDISDNLQYAEDSVGIFPNWRKRGEIYELPFQSLFNGKYPNLSAVGRCLSATDRMWDVTRVIPVCAVSGEAAGVASAMAAQSDCGLDGISVSALQTKLKENGVVLHVEDVLKNSDFAAQKE